MQAIGRLDFVVYQRGREILRIVHFDGLNLWFKENAEGNITPLTREKALKLVRAWMEHHEEVKATISGGLLHYMRTKEIINTEKLMQELKTKMTITMSGLVFAGRR